MDWLSQFFLNPSALAGTALVGVPILIYLIQRRRYRRRRWAAMEFLLRAMKQNQRRIQLRNLLLLLVRTAIVFFLVMAIAKPVFRQSPLSLSPQESQRWVFVIDDSYSMGYAEAGRSFFGEAIGKILQMMDTTLREEDEFAVVLAGSAPRIVLPRTGYNEPSKERLRRELEGLQLSSGALDLGASLVVIDEACQAFVTEIGEPEHKRILVFSDFQRKDWLGSDGPRDPTAVTVLEKIQNEHGEFALANVAFRDNPMNMAVTSLSVTPALVAKDVWVEIRASVRNFGAEPAQNVDLNIRVDPEWDAVDAEPQLGNVIDVPAGGTVVRTLPYKFDTAGYHTVVAELRSDGLVIDNQRFLVVRVEDDVRVLLVDGEPAGDALQRETFHLEVALQPEDDDLGRGGGRFTPFEPEYRTFAQLNDVDWNDYAVVILANVAEVSEEQAQAIHNYVENGGALMVFLGDQVRPETYNRLFHVDGGLLPLALNEVRGDERFPVFLQVTAGSHPVAAYFAEREEVTHLRLIPFSHYFLTEKPADDEKPTYRVPFRYNDIERNPAVFDHGVGKGRVLWMTSSADIEWNEFSKWPDFVVFLYESMSYLVRFGATSANLVTGELFQRRYSSNRYASEVILHAPARADEEFSASTAIRKDMRDLEGGAELEITHDATSVPGHYRLDLLRPNRPEPDSTEYFSVNLRMDESDLQTMTTDDFQEHFSSFKFQVYDFARDLRSQSDDDEILRGKEYWRACLYAVLALLIVETLLAYWMGRRSE